MSNMFYYKYYFNITERGLRFKKSVDANNQASAYSEIKRQHPYADTIVLIRSRINNI